jgi:hypothetical protein
MRAGDPTAWRRRSAASLTTSSGSAASVRKTRDGCTEIRAWSAENVKWVGSYLAFPGRIDREKWVDQARELATGHETEFSRRVAAGKVATSKDDGSHGQGNVQIVK